MLVFPYYIHPEAYIAVRSHIFKGYFTRSVIADLKGAQCKLQ